VFSHFAVRCVFAVRTNRIQSVMRYHGARGSIAANNDMLDVEDRFDVLVDANDQLLERVVSSSV